MNELATSRDFTVAVFVIQHDHVILHPHAKLEIWLPPGGHIDPGELPDEAAIREVLEESGIAVELMGERGIRANLFNSCAPRASSSNRSPTTTNTST
jgi:8-oxo-dGTP pyrophosphatase MutT (NUDIX family)